MSVLMYNTRHREVIRLPHEGETQETNTFTTATTSNTPVTPEGLKQSTHILGFKIQNLTVFYAV